MTVLSCEVAVVGSNGFDQMGIVTTALWINSVCAVAVTVIADAEGAEPLAAMLRNDCPKAGA